MTQFSDSNIQQKFEKISNDQNLYFSFYSANLQLLEYKKIHYRNLFNFSCAVKSSTTGYCLAPC